MAADCLIAFFHGDPNSDEGRTGAMMLAETMNLIFQVTTGKGKK